jgi:hypothetical protein
MTAGDQILRDSVRAVLAAGTDHESVSAALDEQGWAGIASAEGDPAWQILFEEAAVGLSGVHPLELLLGPALASVGAPTRLVYATSRTPAQQAADVRSGRPPYPRGVVRAGGQQAGQYVVLTVRADGELTGGGVTTGVADASDISLDPGGGLDPDLGLQGVQLHAVPQPLPGPDHAELSALISRAQILQSYSLRALSDRMLAIAIEHVNSRHQFGRPVGSFQAVKHLLADCAVELESLRTVLAYASETADPVAVIAARALAGRASHLVGRSAQQVTGAMGFSAEFPLHRYVRRAHSFDLLLGPWPVHARTLGQLALSSAAVPRLGEA